MRRLLLIFLDYGVDIESSWRKKNLLYNIIKTHFIHRQIHRAWRRADRHKRVHTCVCILCWKPDKTYLSDRLQDNGHVCVLWSILGLDVNISDMCGMSFCKHPSVYLWYGFPLFHKITSTMELHVMFFAYLCIVFSISRKKKSATQNLVVLQT